MKYDMSYYDGRSTSIHITTPNSIKLTVGFEVTVGGVGAVDSVGGGVTIGALEGRGVALVGVGFCVGTGTGSSVYPKR